MTASLDMREKMSMELAVPPLEMAWPLPTRKSGPPATPKLFCNADEVSAETGVIDIGRVSCVWPWATAPTEPAVCAPRPPLIEDTDDVTPPTTPPTIPVP